MIGKKYIYKKIQLLAIGLILLQFSKHNWLIILKLNQQAYPATNAVILRHHGIHIWGETWQKAKLMAESYHYLLDMAVEMHKLGINEYTNV